MNSERFACTGSSEGGRHSFALLRVAAAAGLGAIVFTTTPASAITMATPMGVRQSADALDLTEAVHCRRYAHRHKHGHRWGRGCGVDRAVIDPGYSGGVGAVGTSGLTNPSRGLTLPAARSPGNFVNPGNPQDRSGNNNPQDRTTPRSFNPQDMLSR
jgi:hypothetical protein